MNRALLALTLLIALAACKGSESPTSTAPDNKPGITIAEGRLVLPAVKGNPGAAYFNVSNGTDKGVELAAVSIDGAGKAELHDNMAGAMKKLGVLAIGSGETGKLTPGSQHVMVFDLDAKLGAGNQTEMTVTFADGDKVSAPLKIETVGMATDLDH